MLFTSKLISPILSKSVYSNTNKLVLNSILQYSSSSSSNIDALCNDSFPTANREQLNSFANIETKTFDNGVAIIALNKPKSLNALGTPVLNDVVDALAQYERDNTVGAVILTGIGPAFAAGADITEIATKNYMDLYNSTFGTQWHTVSKFKKPLISAVNGFALGGGCELMLTTDIVVASEKAKFGQPEIKLGIIPGAGGTQRLTKVVGKSNAMESCLTGDFISAEEAKKQGLVSHVVPPDQCLPKAMEIASKITQYSKPIVQFAKECVNRSNELSLSEGLLFERRVFFSIFATKDQKEGMKAFIEKRKPEFVDA